MSTATQRVLEAIDSRPQDQVVVLFKGKRLDGRYTLTVGEIARRFRLSVWYHAWKGGGILYMRTALRHFVEDTGDGLNSVWALAGQVYLISAIEDEVLRRERG